MGIGGVYMNRKERQCRNIVNKKKIVNRQIIMMGTLLELSPVSQSKLIGRQH